MYIYIYIFTYVYIYTQFNMEIYTQVCLSQTQSNACHHHQQYMGDSPLSVMCIEGVSRPHPSQHRRTRAHTLRQSNVAMETSPRVMEVFLGKIHMKISYKSWIFYYHVELPEGHWTFPGPNIPTGLLVLPGIFYDIPANCWEVRSTKPLVV